MTAASPMAVYTIRNRLNGKIYNGQTTRGALLRFREHLRDAERHKDDYCFHNAIRKYGPENFELVCEMSLGERPQEDQANRELSALEIGLIAQLNSTDSTVGYNRAHGGEGVEFTPEVRAKMSASAKKRWALPENRAKIGAANKKWMSTPENRAKASERQTQRMASPENRAKLSAATKAQMAARTPEQQEQIERNRFRLDEFRKKLTPEERSAQSRKQWVGLTPEQRAAKLKHVQLDPEKRLAGVLRANHVRWHVQRGISDQKCKFCREQAGGPRGEMKCRTYQRHMQ